MGAADNAPILTIRARGDLRNWLGTNHGTSRSVWLASCKRHQPDYAAIIEDLLCWGWIDSVTRALNADRSMILIAPRKVTSGWSAIDKAHVERARTSSAMTPAGETKIAAALANGMWDFVTDVDGLQVPGDLTGALGQGVAASGWDAYPKSVRRGTLEWVKTVRTAATRSARIADVASSAAMGLRPKPYRR